VDRWQRAWSKEPEVGGQKIISDFELRIANVVKLSIQESEFRIQERTEKAHNS
jgi:hypothetical protein